MNLPTSLFRLAALSLALVSPASGQLLWEAFNDHRAGADTSPNASTWDMRGIGSGGPFKDIATGIDLAASFVVEEEGATDDFGANSAVNPGSPIDLLFAGKCTIGGAANPGIPGVRNSTSTVLRLVFTDLDPNRRYVFRGATCRGNNYVDRWIIFKIIEAESAVAAHTDGSVDQNLFTADTFPQSGILPDEVVLNSGDNKAGSLIGWDNINPGADGTFAIEARQYIGVAPFGTPSAGPYAYGLSAMYLAAVQGGLGDRLLAIDHDPVADTTELTWSSQPGELFEVRKSLDLSTDPSTWPAIATQVSAAPAPAEATTLLADTAASETRAFYKVYRVPRPALFEDDLESGAVGWTTVVNDASGNTQWQLGTPVGTTGPLTGADGSANAWSTNLGDYGPDSDTSLRSPAIDLSGVPSAILRFQAYRDADGFGDTATVRFLRAGDQVQLGAATPIDMSGFDSNWIPMTIAVVPEAIGETVLIEWNFISDDSADAFSGLSIDNVTVTVD